MTLTLEPGSTILPCVRVLSSPDSTVSTDGDDWLKQAAVGDHNRQKSRKPGSTGAGSNSRPLPTTTSKPAAALSWLSKMKRRSSSDSDKDLKVDDDDVTAPVAPAKKAAAPGGWLQMGTLGAPDAVEEEKALEEGRAAIPPVR